MKTTIKTLFLFFSIYSFSINCFAGPNEDLHLACKTGDLTKATEAINAGADVNNLEGGNPPIVSAFFWPEITRLLLDKGANPNLGAFPAVVQASLNYSTEVLKMLLDAGADPNKPGIVDGSSTLKTLIEKEKAKGKSGNKDLIKAWEGALSSIKPTEMYALQSALMSNGCVPCIEMLLAKGAKTKTSSMDGNLLHIFAASTIVVRQEWINGYPQAKSNMEAFGLKLPDWYATLAGDRLGSPEQKLKVILKHENLNINEKDKTNRTPLEVALNTGLANKKEIIMAFIENGAGVKLESKTYGPLIFQASQTGFVEIVKAMVDKGVDINTEGQFFAQLDGALVKGFTPLTIAAQQNRLDLLKYLISQGAKTDIPVKGQITLDGCLAKVNGKTAIYYAIEHNNLEMVKFIIDNKAFNGEKLSIEAKGLGRNNFGGNCIGGGSYKPSNYAKELGKTEIMEYLKSLKL